MQELHIQAPGTTNLPAESELPQKTHFTIFTSLFAT
jgi:hypothetical protein